MNSSGGLSAALHAERLAKLGTAAALSDKIAGRTCRPRPNQATHAGPPCRTPTGPGNKGAERRPGVRSRGSARRPARRPPVRLHALADRRERPLHKPSSAQIRGRRLSTDPSLYGSVQPRITVVCLASNLRVFGRIGMEQLWNRGGATGGKGSGRKKPKMA